MAAEDPKKSPTALREEEVLAHWQKNEVFKQTLEKPAPKGDFVFYDGPPFATGLPHYGSLLSSVIKDVVPRYKTMQGYHVRRRWGWDCHGLPIESLVEKQLGLKSKKDIENLGVAQFNETAKSMVLQYAHDWEKYVERIGRWTEFKNAYKTMDNSYIESVWWGLSELYKKKLLYEGRKVLMYCPHCETPLAKAEIAMDNSYEDVTEEAVTVKFKVKNPEKYGLPENTFILAWTTTPWTLPGNVALAVGEEIDYVVVEVSAKASIDDAKEDGSHPESDKSDDYYAVLAKARLETHEKAAKLFDFKIVKELKGKDLVGIEYEPLFPIEKVKAVDMEHNAWKVYPADFVTTEDGTGIVHTAVIYGEDDYQLGVKEKLPMVPMLTANGRFNDDAPEFIRGKYFKHHKRGFPQAEKGEDAEHFIKKNLASAEGRGYVALFDKQAFTHSYPHCYRCGTPLIYNAITSWFINIQAVKEKMLAHNQESVNWYPEHLKEGRFKHIVENAPDWTISRNRYWASPLPIWKNQKTGEVLTIGSLEELKRHTKKSGNHYFLMRHGESVSNVKGVLDSKGDPANTLTEKGIEQVTKVAATLAGAGITAIYASPLVRTRITAETVADVIGLPKDKVFYDNRLLESGVGAFDGKPINEYHSFFGQLRNKMTVTPEGGENWHDTKIRMASVLYELETKHANETVLIISHSGPLEMLQAAALGLTDEETGSALEEDRFGVQNGEVRELPFVPLPHNASFELDLHRPYIDEVVLLADDGMPLERIPEVVDCWVESGSMPFAELNYLGEGSAAETEFKKRFPGDFIAEYIAQTRTWFYYMHAMGSLLFDSPAFKNVVSTGTILAGDGSKMSKSKGNYTDPLSNLDLFGADALRFYLLGSVVMQSEDLKFKDEELKDVHNRVINILWNTFKFYDLYRSEWKGTEDPTKSPHLLDRWIMARLSQLVHETTKHMEGYDTVRTARSITQFVDDFSTWYVRRSRDRVKSEDENDKQRTLSTMRHVFIELSKVIAPMMPFIAESIYRGAGGTLASVHLEAWPEAPEPDMVLIEKMAAARAAVSVSLQKRAAAALKVRQPLASVTIKNETLKNDPELLSIIAEEVNVKTVIVDPGAAEDAVLDTVITPELKEEGDMRDLLRAIQELRKKEGFAPGEAAILALSGDTALLSVFENHREKIAKAASIVSVTSESSGEEVAVGDMKARIALTRV